MQAVVQLLCEVLRLVLSVLFVVVTEPLGEDSFYMTRTENNNNNNTSLLV